MMQDKNGTQILEGVDLYSIKFGKSGPKMKCFGYRENDGYIILMQDRDGERQIYLSQQELLNSHWVVGGEEENDIPNQS